MQKLDRVFYGDYVNRTRSIMWPIIAAMDVLLPIPAAPTQGPSHYAFQ